MNHSCKLALAAAGLAAALGAGPVLAQQSTEVGSLDCNVEGGVGMIITSSKEMVCTFTNSRGQPEVYFGTIRRFGLDIGATRAGKLVWGVFAPANVPRGALAGTYGGAGAEATAGVGLGANALFGGSNRSIALQPLAMQGQTGLNVAAGVTSLELRAGERVRGR